MRESGQTAGSYLLQIACQMEQDRYAGGHLEQPHNQQRAEQYRPISGLGRLYGLEAVLAGLHVDGVAQIGSVLAVGSCHDARLRKVRPKVRDPEVDECAGKRVFTGTPEPAGGWATAAQPITAGLWETREGARALK